MAEPLHRLFRCLPAVVRATLPRMCLVAMLAGLLTLPGGAALAQDRVPRITIHDGGASAGYLRLEWRWEGEGEGVQPVYDIEMARRESFGNPRRVYRGPDEATFLSGLADGTYYFRGRVWLRGEPVTAWSGPVRAEIEHHPVGRALGLFALGGGVFAATVALILFGRRRVRKTS